MLVLFDLQLKRMTSSNCVAFVFNKIGQIFAGCFCWKAKIQCKLSACVSTDKGSYLPHLFLHFDHSNSSSSYDITRHLGVLSCNFADWMGIAPGQLFITLCLLSHFFIW